MPFRDVGKARPKPINGFPRLAAKIAELEALQDQCDYADSIHADMITVNCYSDWKKFKKCAGEKDANGHRVQQKQKEKMELALKIKEKLKEYHEALAVHQTLLNSKPPAPTTVKAMRNWFLDTSSNKSGPRPQLWGNSEKKYDDIHDLVALRVPADQDRLSEFILNHFSYFFKTTQQDEQSAYISERSIAKFVAILSSILSAILLFGSITSLYFVHNPYALLGMLGGWTVLFATCVGWLTNAKRDQVFAATAAYAAVLVVFVSGTLGGALSNTILGSCNCTQT